MVGTICGDGGPVCRLNQSPDVRHRTALAIQPPHQAGQRPLTAVFSGARGQCLGDVSLVAAIDQDEEHPAGLAGSVGPGVIGAPLNNHAAWAQRDFAVVQHQRELALDHDAVVHRLRPVHERMRRALLDGGGLDISDFTERRLHVFGATAQQFVGVGRDVHKPDAGAQCGPFMLTMALPSAAWPVTTRCIEGRFMTGLQSDLWSDRVRW